MNGELMKTTLTSMEVADMVGKKHSELLKDIRRYMEQLNEVNIPLVDFFQESTYTDSKGETRPCYEITKKGCEFIAHKLTGIKGTEFTAKYINRFHDMEDVIKKGTKKISSNKKTSEELEIQKMRAEDMKLNAKTRAFKELKAALPKEKLSDVAMEVYGIKFLEDITGKNQGEHLPTVKKTYSATELGKLLGLTKNKIGRITTQNGLKTEEYGIEVMDKSPYSVKEMPTFRYYETVIPKIKEILEKE